MKVILMTVLVVALGSCASQNKMMTEYKEMTKDVCVDNPHEVVLAQYLYNTMRKTN